MKRFILSMAIMLMTVFSASAMSYEQARDRALFLTDKMAYELNLNDEQYEAAYEVNLDYLMSINTYDDLYGTYWTRRNLDLSYILFDWQYSAFCSAAYFYRPLTWSDGVWRFGIYARYPSRTYFYFGRPGFYLSYRGGHSWHMNGGHSWYHGRDFGPRPGESRFGMRDRFDRGDFRGSHNHGGFDRPGDRPGRNDHGFGRGDRRPDNNGNSGFGRNDRKPDNNGNGGFRGGNNNGSNNGGYRGGNNNGGYRGGNNGGNNGGNDKPQNGGFNRGSFAGRINKADAAKFQQKQTNDKALRMNENRGFTTRQSSTRTTVRETPRRESMQPSRSVGSSFSRPSSSSSSTFSPSRSSSSSNSGRSFGGGGFNGGGRSGGGGHMGGRR